MSNPGWGTGVAHQPGPAILVFMYFIRFRIFPLLRLIHQQKRICVWARSASLPGLFFYFERLASPGVCAPARERLGASGILLGVFRASEVRPASCARLGQVGSWVGTRLGRCFWKFWADSSEFLASFFGVRLCTFFRSDFLPGDGHLPFDFFLMLSFYSNFFSTLVSHL